METTSLHGTLVMVHGMGVLITGSPEIGKSETALTLIKWGHNLVADDKVDIRLAEKGVLVGTCPPAIYGFIELRGIGVVDVHEIYGQRSLIKSCHVDLIASLTSWENNKTYDRFGETEHYKEILGQNVPYYEIPVKVGRNIAAILEVLALHQKAKQNGRYAYKTLSENVKEFMSENKRDKQPK